MIRTGADGSREASFSLRNRILRQLWQFVWILLFRPSPRPMHRWRSFLLRVFGATIGRNVHVYPSVRIWAPWNLKLGDDVGVGDDVKLYSMADITIGRRGVVSQGTHLCTGSHDYNSPNFQLFARPIEIGERAWICAEVFVGPGVSVHSGCVIGAREVLMKSTTAPNQIWTGNPASMTGQRHI